MEYEMFDEEMTLPKLLEVPDSVLHSMELSRWNRSVNAERGAKELTKDAARLRSAALHIRWVRVNRAQLLRMSSNSVEVKGEVA